MIDSITFGQFSLQIMASRPVLELLASPTTTIASQLFERKAASSCRISVALHIVSNISQFVHTFFAISRHDSHNFCVPVVCETRQNGKSRRLGLREISAADEAQPGQTVVIRAHGIPVGEQRMLSARGALTVDATCPFVKKIHVIAQKAERDGRSLLIIGTPTHPEIIAIASYSSDAHVFQSAEALETRLPLKFRAGQAAQTARRRGGCG